MRQFPLISDKLAGYVMPVIVFISALIVTGVLTIFQPQLYESQARIWVQPRTQASQKDVFSPLSTFFTSPLVTASEIIKSGVVLEQARAILKKQNPNGRWPTLVEMGANLTAKPVTNADVLKVTYRSTDSTLASKTLQSILDAFMLENSSQSTGSAAQSRVSIEKQLETLRKQSAEARKALKQFQDRNQAIDLSEQIGNLLRQAAASEAQIEKYKLKLAEQKSKIDYLQSQLGLGPEDALLAYKLAQDDQLFVLGKKIAVDEARLISLRGAYRDEHPFIKELKASVAGAKAAQQERLRLLAEESGGNVQLDKLNANDPVRQKLLEEMVSAKSEEMSAQSGLTQSTSLLADTNARLANIPAAQIQVAELSRRDKVASEALSDAERSLHSATLSEAIASYAANIRVIDWPMTPTAPAYPNVPVNICVGAFVGLVLAALTFFAGPVLWRPADVQRILNLPIVDWMEHLPAQGSLPSSLVPLHRLRLGIQHLLSQDQKCILITSPERQDGKTLISAALALSFAQSGARVLLIDANLGDPGIHKVFDLNEGPGLTDYNASDGTADLARLIRSVGPSLDIVTRGSSKSRSGTLATGTVRDIVAICSSHADVIIIDTPAFKDSAESLSLLESTSILLVVVRLNHTSRTSLRLLQAQLRRRQVASAGVVLVGATDKAVAGALHYEQKESAVESSVWS